MKKTIVAVGALVAASALAGFDPSVCRIPEKFKDHPLFTKPVVGVNFGFGGRRGYYEANMAEPAKMKAAGVNWCVLKVHPMVEHFYSQKIFFDPVFTVGEMETEAMVNELHRNGIHVMLQPCVMPLDSASMASSFGFPSDTGDIQTTGTSGSRATGRCST